MTTEMTLNTKQQIELVSRFIATIKAARAVNDDATVKEYSRLLALFCEEFNADNAAKDAS